ncbi:MAG: hypothetical protein ACOCRX_09415 [Candidatus Woesearchaeota archaeon]
MLYPHFIKNKILPLLIEENQLYYTKFNNKVYKSTLPDLEDEIELFTFPVAKKEKIFIKHPITNKILRLGPHSLQKKDNLFVISLRKRIIVIKNNNILFFKNFNGSRPLNISRHNNYFYWGEYFSNPERKEVKIFSLNSDKMIWEPIFTYPENSIRHIHSIVYDNYRNGFWIQTGDKNDESALWFTTDFKDVKPYGNLSQDSRAVKIIPTKNFLVVPTDTPQQRNFINYYYPQDNNLEQIIDLPGSAFHAEETKSYFVVSTVVEPSVINKSKESTIWINNKKDKNWYLLFSAKKNFFPLSYQKYFRYAELAIVPSSNRSKFIVAFGRSLKNYEGKTLIWNTDLL